MTLRKEIKDGQVSLDTLDCSSQPLAMRERIAQPVSTEVSNFSCEAKNYTTSRVSSPISSHPLFPTLSLETRQCPVRSLMGAPLLKSAATPSFPAFNFETRVNRGKERTNFSIDEILKPSFGMKVLPQDHFEEILKPALGVEMLSSQKNYHILKSDFGKKLQLSQHFNQSLQPASESRFLPSQKNDLTTEVTSAVWHNEINHDVPLDMRTLVKTNQETAEPSDKICMLRDYEKLVQQTTLMSKTLSNFSSNNSSSSSSPVTDVTSGDRATDRYHRIGNNFYLGSHDMDDKFVLLLTKPPYTSWPFCHTSLNHFLYGTNLNIARNHSFHDAQTSKELFSCQNHYLFHNIYSSHLHERQKTNLDNNENNPLHENNNIKSVDVSLDHKSDIMTIKSSQFKNSTSDRNVQVSSRHRRSFNTAQNHNKSENKNSLSSRQDCMASIGIRTANPAHHVCPTQVSDYGNKDKERLAWPAWVYCTRYSDRPSSGPRYRKPRKQITSDNDKRPRTAFSTEQLQRLKNEFDTCPYLSENRRHQLSMELALNESQVKIWFQNKRAKLKKFSGSKNLLAERLMEEGLYNHSTIVVDDEEDKDSNQTDD